MTPIERLMHKIIAHQGPITIEQFMALALTHPEHGYYQHAAAIGAGGDFITAPEVNQMFGELLGLWCVDIWHQIGKPASMNLIELGPGRGTLMADAMRAISTASPELAGSVKIHLVEINPTLRAAQAMALISHNPIWHEDITQLPGGARVILANEYFDALPIRQFVQSPSTSEARGWSERVIGVDPENGEMCFQFDEKTPEGALIAEQLAKNGHLTRAGSLAELSPQSEAQMATLAEHVSKNSGALLTIDYGYEKPDGADTLQAMRRHTKQSVFEDIGNADLTAHVDFGALASAAKNAGATAHGPATQGAFLKRLGIEERLRQLSQSATITQQRTLLDGFNRLTASDQMGELFKVLAITSDDIVPVGFNI